MQIKISTRHGQVSDETRDFIEKKAQKLLHLFPRLIMIEITLDMRDDLKEVELLAEAEHKHNFVAKEQHKEILTAMDSALSKVEAQLRKYKQKVQNHRGTPNASEVAGSPILEETSEE